MVGFPFTPLKLFIFSRGSENEQPRAELAASEAEHPGDPSRHRRGRLAAKAAGGLHLGRGLCHLGPVPALRCSAEVASKISYGRNPLCTTLKPGNTMVCWYLQGEPSLQGFLDGAGLRPSTIGPPARCQLSRPFFGWEGSPTEIDCRKKVGTLTLTSLLEDRASFPRISSLDIGFCRGPNSSQGGLRARWERDSELRPVLRNPSSTREPPIQRQRVACFTHLPKANRPDVTCWSSNLGSHFSSWRQKVITCSSRSFGHLSSTTGGPTK